jgi:CO dehydrogenase/acetyl-CoA synthase beta subunit
MKNKSGTRGGHTGGVPGFSTLAGGTLGGKHASSGFVYASIIRLYSGFYCCVNKLIQLDKKVSKTESDGIQSS